MIKKVYMNREKNEAHIIFDDRSPVRLSSDKVLIEEFYLWFISDVNYPLFEYKQHHERVARSLEDTVILELDDVA